MKYISIRKKLPLFFINSSRKPSGPKTRDPYENEESPAMLPIFVAIGAFIPLVFCMCKLEPKAKETVKCFF